MPEQQQHYNNNNNNNKENYINHNHTISNHKQHDTTTPLKSALKQQHNHNQQQHQSNGIISPNNNNNRRKVSFDSSSHISNNNNNDGHTDIDNLTLEDIDTTLQQHNSKIRQQYNDNINDNTNTTTEQIKHILDNTHNNIYKLLDNLNQHKQSLQQQIIVLQNTNKQYESDKQQFNNKLEAIKQDTIKQQSQLVEQYNTYKYNQYKAISDKLYKQQVHETVLVCFGYWFKLYNNKKYNNLKQKHKLNIKNIIDDISNKYETKLNTLQQTITQQNNDIIQYKNNQVMLADKLKVALLRSVTAVNNEAINVLNDPLYHHTEHTDVIINNHSSDLMPRDVKLLPQPSMKHTNTQHHIHSHKPGHSARPHTADSSKQGINIVKQANIHNNVTYFR